MGIVVCVVGCAGDGVYAGAAGSADAHAVGAVTGSGRSDGRRAAANVDAGRRRRCEWRRGKFCDATADGAHDDAFCDAYFAQPDAATADADAYGDAAKPDAVRELYPGSAADG